MREGINFQHDTTIDAFLRTLQAKQEVLDYTTPEYAAVVLLELWKNGRGEPYIKVSDTYQWDSSPRPETKMEAPPGIHFWRRRWRRCF